MTQSPEDSAVDWQWGVQIPVRDGVRLNATVYRPKHPEIATPCVVTLTPYVSDRYHKRGMYFASRGLAFVVVDVRGRGNSEGQFEPFRQEAQDGYDVVEWLAQQSYCNGKVAMWGGSYSGYNQWTTAGQRPPHLTTIVPMAAPYMGADFPMRNNIVYPYVVQWLVFTAGRASQEMLFSDAGFWSGKFRDWFRSGRPLRQLDRLIGYESALFQEWLDHPHPDAYWDAHNLTANQYEQLRIPVLTITGSYDDDQIGALTHYRLHVAAAGARRDVPHYLVIGPWDHAGTSTPSQTVGGLEFGPESLVNVADLHRSWYAWVMQDGPEPAFLRKSVAYYVMGAERWRYSDTLEGTTARHETWFLDSQGAATDVFSAGVIGPDSSSGASSDGYRYDPRELGLEIDCEAKVHGASLIDQSLTFALRGQQLVYHSAPFGQDREITGFFRLTAWISIDCSDTDFYVSVHEITLDGGSIRLSADAVRARYREGPRSPKLIRTPEPLPYEFSRFTFVSRRIRRGHRLRLVIAPMGRLIDSPFAGKNYNGGGVVADESIKDAKAVTVRLLHDRAHPSALYVPWGLPDSDHAGSFL
jgi:putative CocE/NonD family hydrolase